MSGLVRTYSAWSRVQSRSHGGVAVVGRGAHIDSQRTQRRQLVVGSAPSARDRGRPRRAGPAAARSDAERRQLVGKRLPDAVPVEMTTCCPAWASSAASLVPLVRRCRVLIGGPDVVGDPGGPVREGCRAGGYGLEMGQRSSRPGTADSPHQVVDRPARPGPVPLPPTGRVSQTPPTARAWPEMFGPVDVATHESASAWFDTA